MFREALTWIFAGWCAVIGGFIAFILLGTMAFNLPMFLTMMAVPVITSPVAAAIAS